MTDTEPQGIACHDCEGRFRRNAIVMAEVPITHDEGYDMVSVPICRDCRGTRFGFDCPQCGLTHDTKDDAQYCCERAPGAAPNCPECHRRMERTAHGFTATGRPTCEFAECEACGIQWGKFTGWHGLEADD